MKVVGVWGVDEVGDSAVENGFVGISIEGAGVGDFFVSRESLGETGVDLGLRERVGFKF